MTSDTRNAPVGDGKQTWESLGRILHAQDAGVSWMHAYAGSAFAIPAERGEGLDVYVTGRDSQNRSQIGRVRLVIDGQPRVVDVDSEPALALGARGTFDENGVSYPCLVRHGGQLLLFYTGWVPTVLTAFQNDLGLAVQAADGRFQRVSRAPILARSDDDHLGIGSSFVSYVDGRWHLWYTSFRRWASVPSDPKHTYWIKYARGETPYAWERNDVTAVGLQHPGEYVACRPSVIHEDGLWHMWYCWRGPHYRLGYAVSRDGVRFERRDDDIHVPRSSDGFDSYEQCYPHVFRYRGSLYMLYCGNGYGREGLGLARLVRS